MSLPGWIRWTALALLGLAVAAGISIAASHLVSQRIGLASEPLSAGLELAPPPRDDARGPEKRARARTTEPTTSTTTTTAVPVPPPSTTTTAPPYSGVTTAPAAPGGGSGEGAEPEPDDD